MISKLIPVLFLMAGMGAGIGTALLLGKGPAGEADHAEAPVATPEQETSHGPRDDVEYVRLSNQFVVPIMRGDAVSSLIVLSLSLETEPGLSETVFAREPKLRDGFLRVLFDHANMGGFDGAFTRADTMGALRQALNDVARAELGKAVLDVLILDVARQDV